MLLIPGVHAIGMCAIEDEESTSLNIEDAAPFAQSISKGHSLNIVVGIALQAERRVEA